MPSPPRDKNATWRTLGTLCRELDWSRRRLIHELENGWPYRTVPEGYAIDWADAVLNIESSEVRFCAGEGGVHDLGHPFVFLDTGYLTVGIEVLSPTDVPAPSPALSPTPPPSAPLMTPPTNTVSNAELRDCILAIVDEYPDDPLDEDALWELVEKRLGRSVGRDRVRNARKKFAPQWVNPVGRPRK